VTIGKGTLMGVRLLAASDAWIAKRKASGKKAICLVQKPSAGV
jgi:hypothetical protein